MSCYLKLQGNSCTLRVPTPLWYAAPLVHILLGDKFTVFGRWLRIWFRRTINLSSAVSLVCGLTCWIRPIKREERKITVYLLRGHQLSLETWADLVKWERGLNSPNFTIVQVLKCSYKYIYQFKPTLMIEVSENVRSTNYFYLLHVITNI